MYKSLLLLDLEKISMSSFTDSTATVDKITDLLIDHSLPLADTRLKPCKKKNKRAIYVRLPADVKIARSQCKAAFDSGKTTNILATMKYTTFTVQNVQFMSNFRLTLKLLVPNVKLHLILGKTTNILSIVCVCYVFSIKLKPTKSKSFAMQRALMRN